MTSDATTLYRAFDADGALLYIGIAFDWTRRMQQHARGSDWARDAAIVKLEHFKTRERAATAELEAIKKENPKFNRSPGPKPEPNSLRPKKGPLEDFWEYRNRHPGADLGLYTLSLGEIDVDDAEAIDLFGEWITPHLVVNYPKRLARFTELWKNGDIPDGFMSHKDIIEEMNRVDPKAPRIKSTGSYGNWKAKGFPGFQRPE